jgi:thioredoxin reductase (NADPH)
VKQTFDVVVLGGGLAGLSAAYNVAIRGWEVGCIQEAALYGGLLTNVGQVDGMQGFNGMAGASVADLLVTECRNAGVTFIDDKVVFLTGKSGQMKVQGEADSYSGRRVIAATGALQRSLGVKGEKEFTNRGVSTCAWCDGGLYRNERVAVVGAGDSALQAALHLAQLCERVDILVRDESLKARQSYVSAAANQEKISFHWATSVEAVNGGDSVTGITIRADQATDSLPCTGLFVYAGLVPNSAMLPAEIDRDDDAALIVGPDFETSWPGLFAAGAVRSGYQGQGLNALSDGVSAAIGAIAQLLEE